MNGRCALVKCMITKAAIAGTRLAVTGGMNTKAYHVRLIAKPSGRAGYCGAHFASVDRAQNTLNRESSNKADMHCICDDIAAGR